MNEESQCFKFYTEVKIILKDANFNTRQGTTNVQSRKLPFDLKE